MLGWIIAALGAGYVINKINEKKEERENTFSLCGNVISEQQKIINKQNVQIGRLQEENRKLKLTISNQSKLLSDYDKINKYAKYIGFNNKEKGVGAVAFFYYLAKYHDSRFEGLARFLYKVKCMRNEVAHTGVVYEIDQGFLKKLNACWKVCEYHKQLSYGEKLLLN